MEYIKVEEGLPEDSNDCRVLFEDGTEGIAYFSTAGCSKREEGTWCEGMPIPCSKKVVAWCNLGNCDSIKQYNKNW